MDSKCDLSIDNTTLKLNSTDKHRLDFYRRKNTSYFCEASLNFEDYIFSLSTMEEYMDKNYNDSLMDKSIRGYNSPKKLKRKEVERILISLEESLDYMYQDMKNYSISRDFFSFIIKTTIEHTLKNIETYKDDIYRKTNLIYDTFQKDLKFLYLAIRGYHLPTSKVDTYIKTIINLTLKLESQIRLNSVERAWSPWSSLDINLYSKPYIVFCQKSKTALLLQGTNNNLFYKSMEGNVFSHNASWSNWKNLGGTILSSPSAIYRGDGSLDVFARGINNNLIHRHFCEAELSQANPFLDNRNINDYTSWNNLGGNLTSSPSVVYLASGNFHVFARGINNNLIHKTYKKNELSRNSKVQSLPSFWENLGGNLSSEPVAISWGENRIDVFCRSSKNTVLNKYCEDISQGSACPWSDWIDLGGDAISVPSAASRAKNRLDIFVRNRKNQLLFKFWNGVSWSNWSVINDGIFSAPYALSYSADRLDIFSKGLEGKLRHMCYK